MFGQAIQLWSFASLVKNEQLTARGPYVMVRNPMYLGRYFLILGFVVVTGSVWAAVAYTVFYWFYMDNRVRREETRLAQLLGEPYRHYCATVNRFLPNLLKLGAPAVRFFDLGVMRHNNGHWNLLATLIAWAVLYGYLTYLR
jgi:protein-S-isoprenylcysteine O-methyltransferase Ste14